jgi:hypothetical protein
MEYALICVEKNSCANRAGYDNPKNCIFKKIDLDTIVEICDTLAANLQKNLLIKFHCIRPVFQPIIGIKFFDYRIFLSKANRRGLNMIIRIARISVVVLVFGLLIGARPAIGDGGLLPKLFPDSKTETKKAPPKPTKPQPSALNKMTTGTKKFFSNVGDTLTFKKSAPPKQSTTPTNPWIKPAKEEPKPSWFSSMFAKEEPKKAKTPSQWLEQKRLDP